MRFLLSGPARIPRDGAADAPRDDPGDDVDLDMAYALPEPRVGIPHVRSNFVMSIDGAIEIGGRSGALGGPADLRVFRALRWLSDVVLVGAGTARTEDYGPVLVPAERRERRVAAGLAPVPPVAVVTGSLAFDPAARLFTAAVRPLLLTCEAAPGDRRRTLARLAEIVVCGERSVEPRAALDALADRGLLRVLTEGGPRLHAQFAEAGLLDELCLTVAPVLAGPEHLGLMHGAAWASPVDMGLDHVLEEDGVLFLRYCR